MAVSCFGGEFTFWSVCMAATLRRSVVRVCIQYLTIDNVSEITIELNFIAAGPFSNLLVYTVYMCIGMPAVQVSYQYTCC